MVNKIKNKLELTVYGYDPRYYMPIRYDGKLINKYEFIAYKLGSLITR